MDTLISGATVVTMNEGMEVLLGGFVGITDGKIVYLSKEAPKEKPAAIVDGSGMVLLPGPHQLPYPPGPDGPAEFL